MLIQLGEQLLTSEFLGSQRINSCNESPALPAEVYLNIEFCQFPGGWLWSFY